jgi:arylsulfatase A-like enzyme
MMKKAKCLFATLLLGAAVCAGAARKPNIIVFLTDDQDKESIGAYGNEVWTPNLDRMAKEGMLFHNAFVASTVCTPSRYAFLTGRYASRSTHSTFLHECPDGMQAFPGFNVGLEPDNLNVGAMMKAAGYRTGYVGKFHASGIEGLRTPKDYARYGMEYFPQDAKASPQTSEIFRRNELVVRKMITDRGFDWAKHVYLGNLDRPYNAHNLEWTIDAALEFIEESKDEPFYLHFCTTLVHGPDKSWSNSMQEPLVSGEGELEDPIGPEGMLPRREILAELEKRGLDPSKGHAGYSWVDAGVGAVLSKLEKLGLDNDTLLIFTSDHGSKRKGSLFDMDGACVPFIMRWPNHLKAGTQCDMLVQSIDIAATAFDLAGVKVPGDYLLDGRSLVPLFGGGKPSGWRDHVYVELGTGRAIRTADFKYISIRYPTEMIEKIRSTPDERLPAALSPLGRAGIGTRGAANPNFYYEDALFRIGADPKELKNLAADPEYAPQMAKMQKLLVSDLESIGRPYGELLPGGNAAPPGQVEEHLAFVRQCTIDGKKVGLPEIPSLNNQQRRKKSRQ